MIAIAHLCLQHSDYILCGPSQYRPDGIKCHDDVRVANHHAGKSLADSGQR
jgi:hypothetical protein